MEGQTPFSGAGYDFVGSGKGKARQTEMSHDHGQQPLLNSTYPYCFNCCNYVSEPFTCIENGHFMSSIDLHDHDIMIDDTQDPWNEVSSKDSFACSATDSGQCFSPLEMTQTSFTQDSSSLSAPGFGLVGQPQHYGNFASSSKLAAPSNFHSGYVESHDYHDINIDPFVEAPAAAHGDMPCSDYQFDDDSISEDQEDALQFWKSHCQKRGKLPDDGDFEAIARLTNLNVRVVRKWFFGVVPPIPEPCTDDSEIDESMRRAVAEFARQRHGNPCDNPQSRKAPAHHRYKCTFGCRYSTHDWDTWRRHLKSKYPQSFWICKLCHKAQRAPCIWYRRDKMANHMEKVHPSIEKPQRTRLCESSQVEHQADFPAVCPFFNSRGPCGFRPSSWEKYIEHCKEHFEDSLPGGPWKLPFNDRRRPGDDRDGSGSGRGARKYSKSASRIKSTSTTSTNTGYDGESTHYSQRSHGQTYDARTASPAHLWSEPMDDVKLVQKLYTEHSRLDASQPTTFSLIDIEQQLVVRAPGILRYIALDSSRASRTMPEGAGPHAVLLANAITVTRNMGYRYVWIEEFCATKDSDRSIVYQNALLTIFMVKVNLQAEKIWHFTCHHKNFGTVLKWIEQGVVPLSCSHVRNLGHGAYGIVDEVRLSVDPQPLARKMYLRWRHSDDGGSMPVKELEMLQKLEHENIPKFVAAYISSNALNILMLPVAECNLKELLAQPECWPQQRMHLASWFAPLISALSYMHGLFCRHKDIKPANILVKGHQVYLSDFGTSSDFSTLNESESWGGGIMTPKYCAPEVARRGRRGRKADIFSLGCVFLEMITVELNVPLKELEHYLRVNNSLARRSTLYSRHVKDIQLWLERLRVRASTWIHRTIIDLSQQMLDPDPALRPAAHEVVDILRDQTGVMSLQRGLPQLPIPAHTRSLVRVAEKSSAGSISWVSLVEHGSSVVPPPFEFSKKTSLDLAAATTGIRVASVLAVSARKALSEEELLPCHYSDFMYGTSSGGLVATLLGQLRMTVPEALELIRKSRDGLSGDDLLGQLHTWLRLETRGLPGLHARDTSSTYHQELKDFDGIGLHSMTADYAQNLFLEAMITDAGQPMECQPHYLTHTCDWSIPKPLSANPSRSTQLERIFQAIDRAKAMKEMLHRYTKAEPIKIPASQSWYKRLNVSNGVETMSLDSWVRETSGTSLMSGKYDEICRHLLLKSQDLFVWEKLHCAVHGMDTHTPMSDPGLLGLDPGSLPDDMQDLSHRDHELGNTFCEHSACSIKEEITADSSFRTAIKTDCELATKPVLEGTHHSLQIRAGDESSSQNHAALDPELPDISVIGLSSRKLPSLEQLWDELNSGLGYHSTECENDFDEAFFRACSRPDSISERFSYIFDYSGPSMSVDTACSSSIFAVQTARSALRPGDDEAAIPDVSESTINLKYHDDSPGSQQVESQSVFDTQFFSMAPSGTETLDPTQRLMLHVAYEAIENAGFGPQTRRKSARHRVRNAIPYRLERHEAYHEDNSYAALSNTWVETAWVETCCIDNKNRVKVHMAAYSPSHATPPRTPPFAPKRVSQVQWQIPTIASGATIRDTWREKAYMCNHRNAATVHACRYGSKMLPEPGLCQRQCHIPSQRCWTCTKRAASMRSCEIGDKTSPTAVSNAVSFLRCLRTYPCNRRCYGPREDHSICTRTPRDFHNVRLLPECRLKDHERCQHSSALPWHSGMKRPLADVSSDQGIVPRAKRHKATIDPHPCSFQPKLELNRDTWPACVGCVEAVRGLIPDYSGSAASA